MKKAIVASILGIAASAAFGQGVITINNYLASNYTADQLLWGTGSGHSGVVTPSQNVDVQVYYQIGTISESTAAFLSDPLTHAGVSGGLSSANPGGAYGVGPYGYYSLGNQILTGWSSGPVTFMVAAWQTTTGGGTLAGNLSGGVAGLSALFQAQDDSSAHTGRGIVSSANPAEYFVSMNGVTLTGVPEPTTMALGGLGLAALLIARRKKA